MALTAAWQEIRKTWGHSFHPMCSYMAMFPPRIPHYFIQKFTQPGDVVLDPFSGRGTTAAQACGEGRIGIGNDLNPLAFLLTRAKVDPPDMGDLMERVAELEAACRDGATEAAVDAPDEIRLIFHPHTLAQLTWLKGNLSRDRREDVFLLATLTGILHGKSVGYLSVDMPNTFSMSPNYLRNYIRDHNLELPKRDVFSALRKKILRLYSDGLPTERGHARFGDVRTLSEINEIPAVRERGVKLVVSSPPYLKVVKYGLYNWIRLWLLNERADEVDAKLDDAHGEARYYAFMREALTAVRDVLRDDGVAAFVIGDVATPGKPTVNLAQRVWEECAEPVGLKFKTIVVDEIADNAKVTKIWAKTRGQATKTDRVLVVYKKRYRENPVAVNWTEENRKRA